MLSGSARGASQSSVLIASNRSAQRSGARGFASTVDIVLPAMLASVRDEGDEPDRVRLSASSICFSMRESFFSGIENLV